MFDWKNGNLSEEVIAALLSQQERQDFHSDDVQLKKAAVLIPMHQGKWGWEIFFTRRTDHVQYHKGQVSFPGGVNEPGDVDVAATALRESQEEIGLSPSDVRVLGTMNAMPTPTGYLITPVVGRIILSNPLTRSPSEVDRIFSIPMSWLADRKNWEERDFTRSDGKVDHLVFYQPYDGEVVWGITGRIVVNFLTILGM